MQPAEPDPLSLAAFRAVPAGFALGILGVVIAGGTLVAFSFFGLGRGWARVGLGLGTMLVWVAAGLYAGQDWRRARHTAASDD